MGRKTFWINQRSNYPIKHGSRFLEDMSRRGEKPFAAG